LPVGVGFHELNRPAQDRWRESAKDDIVLENQYVLCPGGQTRADAREMGFENPPLAVGGVAIDQEILDAPAQADAVEFLLCPPTAIVPGFEGNAVNLVDISPILRWSAADNEGCLQARGHVDLAVLPLRVLEDHGSLTGNITLNELAYKIGLRLAQRQFVQSAIRDRADLEPFKQKPTFRILLGIFLIAFSFIACWPAISALGAIAFYCHVPMLAMVGGPILYGLSHLWFLLGMALSGAEYSRIFLRWAARVGVEKLLSFGASDETPEV
jgi:hypothetical protein